MMALFLIGLFGYTLGTWFTILIIYAGYRWNEGNGSDV